MQEVYVFTQAKIKTAIYFGINEEKSEF